MSSEFSTASGLSIGLEMEQEFSPVEVKREPPDDYLLIVPPAPDGSAADQAEAEDVKPKLELVEGCQVETIS